MGALVAADVTVTIPVRRRVEGRNHHKCVLVFGDGSKTYPAGGIPLNIKSFGCVRDLESMVVFDQGTNGYQLSYDFTNQKLRIFQGAVHTHDILLKDASTSDGATTRVNAATNKLGANTGSDITVAGAGVNGGVKNSAVLPLTEFATGAAVAATTVRCEIIGS